jgi:hypothetical protein
MDKLEQRTSTRDKKKRALDLEKLKQRIKPYSSLLMYPDQDMPVSPVSKTTKAKGYDPAKSFIPFS